MNRFIFEAVSAACALCAAVSCSGGFSTQTFTASEKHALSEGGTDSLEIDIQVEYPVSGLTQSALDNVTKTLTTSLFGDQYAAMQPEEAIGAYISGSVDEYRKDNLPLLEMSKDMPHASLSWSDYITGAVAGSHGDILSYTMTKYTYTGGAHGMTSETALNFDMKTGSLLTEGDFFKESYKEKLPALLSGHLASSLENPADTSMLFTREIGPNGNFMVSPEGVTYIYNQYEIGPYVMGAIRVTVPWNELEGLIEE